MIFILVAFFFKVGAAPFHFWLCDVYDGSLITVTLLFSAIPKIIIFGALCKIFFCVCFKFYDFWYPFFLVSGLASIVIGSISALFSKRLKRLLAYSTIAHTGFILLSFISISPSSIQALIFYLFVYLFITILVFSIIILTACSVSSSFPSYLINWTANGSKNITLIITFSLTLFSMAGIPLLVGFFFKILCAILINFG
jgi:NADH-quinone oxidoreductase subunit N